MKTARYHLDLDLCLPTANGPLQGEPTGSDLMEWGDQFLGVDDSATASSQWLIQRLYRHVSHPDALQRRTRDEVFAAAFTPAHSPPRSPLECEAPEGQFIWMSNRGRWPCSFLFKPDRSHDLYELSSPQFGHGYTGLSLFEHLGSALPSKPEQPPQLLNLPLRMPTAPSGSGEYRVVRDPTWVLGSLSASWLMTIGQCENEAQAQAFARAFRDRHNIAVCVVRHVRTVDWH